MAPATEFPLNTGARMPAVGYGTWQAPPGEVGAGVETALKNGYKLIDCAYCYGNEEEVGAGLKAAFDSGIKREDVYITSKVWTTYTTRCELGLEKSLKALGLDYLDLYLIHWPLLMNPQGNDDKFPKKADGSRDIIEDHSHVESWKQMEKLLSSGKVKAIGVCNYSEKYLNELLPHAKVVPAVNQIENHPALPQQEIVDLCKQKGIHIMAYSPLGSTGGPLFKDERVVKVAKKHNVEPAAVLLSYHIPRGSTVLAKSVNPERIVNNLKNIVDLDAEDMKLLDSYIKTEKPQRFVYPAFGIDFGFPDKS